MTWDGEERRASVVREVNRTLVGAVIVIVAVMIFGSAFLNSQRVADLERIACGNAVGHRALTIAVLEDARLTERIADELGLRVEPSMIHVPEVPDQCDSR